MTAKTWPELGIELYDHLTSRNSEITYEFEKMEIDIPSGTGDAASLAQSIDLTFVMSFSSVSQSGSA